MAQIEHHCCAAALVMVIRGGAEVYLDESLELNFKFKRRDYISVPKMQKYLAAACKENRGVIYLFQSTHIHFFYGCDEMRKICVNFCWQNGSNKKFKSFVLDTVCSNLSQSFPVQD